MASLLISTVSLSQNASLALLSLGSIVGNFGLLCLFAAMVCIFPAGNAQAAQSSGAPVKIIFDTDMGNDVDDALALALTHALQNRGVCELLAVTLTHPSPDAAAYVSAFNTFYGRPGIPVGVTPDAPDIDKSEYLPVVRRKGPDGRLLFPSSIETSSAPGSVALLRRMLAAAADGEVVIVQVGFSTNLARLLDTPPDDVSPLTGKELVKRKVRLLSMMAGRFPFDDGNKPEFNVRFDIPSARKVADEWPTPIIWSGWEVGNAVLYPAWSIDRDFDYVPHHPVRESYQAYKPTPHERPCWDLTSIACVVWPDRGYFTLSPAGQVEIGPDGRTTFTARKGGRDYYLNIDEKQSLRLREVFAALVAERPKL